MNEADILRWAAERRASIERRERNALRQYWLVRGTHPDRTGTAAFEAAEATWREMSPAVKEIEFLRETLAKIRDSEASTADIKEAAGLALEYCKTF